MIEDASAFESNNLFPSNKRALPSCRHRGRTVLYGGFGCCGFETIQQLVMCEGSSSPSKPAEGIDCGQQNVFDRRRLSTVGRLRDFFFFDSCQRLPRHRLVNDAPSFTRSWARSDADQ